MLREYREKGEAEGEKVERRESPGRATNERKDREL